VKEPEEATESMIGEVDFGTITAAVNLSTKHGGAARNDSGRCPVMGTGKQMAMGRGKARPMRPKDGRQIHCANGGLALRWWDDF